MFLIEGNRIAVMTTRGIVPLTETERIPGESHVTALDQMQRSMKGRWAVETHRFSHPTRQGCGSLVWTKNGGSPASNVFRDEQICGHTLARLRLISQFLPRVGVEGRLFKNSRFKRRLRCRRAAEEFRKHELDRLTSVLPFS